jgi:hypothetical protein
MQWMSSCPKEQYSGLVREGEFSLDCFERRSGWGTRDVSPSRGTDHVVLASPSSDWLDRFPYFDVAAPMRSPEKRGACQISLHFMPTES